MKKIDMADAAEQLLASTGWLPALLRTPRLECADGRQQTGATYPEAAE